MGRHRVHLPVVASSQGRGGFAAVRRVLQALSLIAIGLAPLLGGWQRLDRNYLAAWEGRGWDLPAWLLDRLPLGEAPERDHS